MIDFGAISDGKVEPAGELGAGGAAAMADIAAKDGWDTGGVAHPPVLVASTRGLSPAAALAVVIGSMLGATTLEAAADGPVGPELPGAW
jgi:hypothetical protein